MPVALGSRLGTRRFQRAVSAKDVLIGIKRLGCRLACFEWLLFATARIRPKRAAILHWVFRPLPRAGSDAYPGIFRRSSRRGL